MPVFENENARIYYEDVGMGEPIITVHGLSEDCNYWSETGVTARLKEKYRVISMDMRGHGRTVVESEPFGFDADTMAADFDALADGLGLDRFHLLSHATGGMVASRYAMSRSARLISLLQTDTGSSTQPEVPDIDWEEMRKQREMMANIDEADLPPIPPLEERIANVRAEPGVFLFKMNEHPDSEKMWPIYEGFLRRQDPKAIRTFMLRFFIDPDPRIEALRAIQCPTLVLLGEFDLVFLKESEIMAREIPDTRHVILDGLGHMTAIEDPQRTADEIMDFLETVTETGKANR